MIKTIIFDIGGVVTNTDFDEVYFKFAERVGLDRDFVKQYHKEKLDDLLLGNISLDQFWTDMKEGGASPDADLKKIWIEVGMDNREVNDELLGIIKELRKKYSVGVLTNVSEGRLLLDEKIDLWSHFDYVLSSCKEGVMKPDERFYKMALEKARVSPEEAVFIDDAKKNIEGAEDLGIHGILYSYDDNSSLVESLKKFGVEME